MAREREDFFAGYDPQHLDQEVGLRLTHRDLLLIRMGLGIFLRDTNRHDHVFNDIHALLAKLPPAPEKREAAVGVSAPDKWLEPGR